MTLRNGYIYIDSRVIDTYSLCPRCLFCLNNSRWVQKMAFNDAQIHWHIENVGGVFEIQLFSQLLITNNLGLPITISIIQLILLLTDISEACY